MGPAYLQDRQHQIADFMPENAQPQAQQPCCCKAGALFGSTCTQAVCNCDHLGSICGLTVHGSSGYRFSTAFGHALSLKASAVLGALMVVTWGQIAKFDGPSRSAYKRRPDDIAF